MKSDMKLLTLEAWRSVQDEKLAAGAAVRAGDRRYCRDLLHHNTVRQERQKNVKRYWKETGGRVKTVTWPEGRCWWKHSGVAHRSLTIGL